MRPTPLEIAAEDVLRRPSVTNDRSREVLAEDFRGNTTPTALSDPVQRVFGRPKRPDPRLLTVAFEACFVDMNHVSLLDLLTELLVLAATGARSALGRMPGGRAGEFEFV